MSSHESSEEREAKARDDFERAHAWIHDNPEEAEAILSEVRGEAPEAAIPVGPPVPPDGNLIDRALAARGPGEIPDVRLLTGYRAASSRRGYIRLYASLDLSRYIEIPDDGNSIHQMMVVPTEQQVEGLAYTKVWIRTGTRVIHVTNESFQVQQRFLSSSSGGSAGSGCGQGSACSCKPASHSCGGCWHGPSGGYGDSDANDPLFEFHSISPC